MPAGTPDLVERHTIGDMPVFVVRDHHHVLIAWAGIRRTLARAPNLITIDHHTDVYEAFLGHAALLENSGVLSAEAAIALRNAMVSKIDWASDRSVLRAIQLLAHDEHIDAATRSDILKSAFVIQLSDSAGYLSQEELARDIAVTAAWEAKTEPPAPLRPPFTYTAAENGIYSLSHRCAMRCEKQTHDDQCALDQGREIIESTYLEDQLQRGAAISRCLGMPTIDAEPYILDIDLDAFHSRKAASPTDPLTFHRLIRGALAITIATEPECVTDLWRDTPPAASQELLQTIFDQITRAITPKAVP